MLSSALPSLVSGADAGGSSDWENGDDALQVGAAAWLEWPFPVMVHAGDGEVIRLNLAWTTLTGYSREELPTVEDWVRRVFAQERAAMESCVARLHAADRGTVVEGEHRVTPAGGGERVWDFTSAPLGSLPDGRRLFVSTARDVTERRRAEERMRAAETQLRRIAAHSPGAIYQFLVRPDGTESFPFVSAGCRELYGLEPAEIEADAEALISLIHPDDLPAFRQSIKDSIRTLQPWLWEGRFVIASGETKWIKAVSQPERQANGDTLWDGMALDVTGERLAEELLRCAKEEAERANTAKSEFLSRMSHELRTPLNAILGFGQLLELDPLPAGQRESVDQILKGGRHLLSLIDEVLDISRVEAGHLTLSLQAVGIGHAMQEAADLVRPLAVQCNVRLSLAPPPDGLTWGVRADPQRLRQVLLNLLANAVKYNRSGGEVTVTCSCAVGPGVRTRVEVRDTGPGLTGEQRRKLFQPFERLGAERGLIEGTGLGLTLCKRLIEAMGGSIGVDSVPGQGSTFWVELLDEPGVVASPLMLSSPPP